MEMVELRHTSKLRWTLRAGAALLAAAGSVALLSAPAAEAARSITPPQWFACGTYHARTISIGPPRIWSSYNRPEQVVWLTSIQRWNGSVWVNYSQFIFWSSFNYYGQSLTSWSVMNTTTGGRYTNSRLNLPSGIPATTVSPPPSTATRAARSGRGSSAAARPAT